MRVEASRGRERVIRLCKGEGMCRSESESLEGRGVNAMTREIPPMTDLGRGLEKIP